MTRDQEIIHQMLAAFDNGEIDWSKVPALQQIIDAEPQRQLVARTNEIDKRYKNAIQKSFNQAIKTEHEQVEKKYHNLEQRVQMQQGNVRNLTEDLDSANKKAAIIPWVIGIGVIMLIATTLTLAWLISPMIIHGTGMSSIRNAVSPNWSFWGVLRGAGGIIGVFLLIALELIIVAIPTTIAVRILMKFDKDQVNQNY